MALIIGSILCISELRSYTEKVIVKEMYIEHDEREVVQVDLNITVQTCPCLLLGVHYQDEMGNIQRNLHDNLTFTRLGYDEEVIDVMYGAGKSNYGIAEQVNEALEGIIAQEGCQISGHIMLKKPPGNFQISYEGKMNLISQLQLRHIEFFRKLRLNFRINSLRFGYNVTENNLIRVFGLDLTDADPYRGRTFFQPQVSDFENFLQILPIRFSVVPQSLRRKQPLEKQERDEKLLKAQLEKNKIYPDRVFSKFLQHQ